MIYYLVQNVDGIFLLNDGLFSFLVQYGACFEFEFVVECVECFFLCVEVCSVRVADAFVLVCAVHDFSCDRVHGAERVFCLYVCALCGGARCANAHSSLYVVRLLCALHKCCSFLVNARLVIESFVCVFESAREHVVA